MTCDIFKVSIKHKNFQKTNKTKSSYNMKKPGMKTRLVRLNKRIAVFVVLALIASAGIYVPIAKADQYDAQINTLQQQNAEAGNQLSILQGQANSYQDAINRLQGQISA